MDKQYRRALTLLKGSDSDLIEQDVRFRYLAAKCLVECREWEECLMMVGGWEEDSLDSIDLQVLLAFSFLQFRQQVQSVMQASLHCILATACVNTCMAVLGGMLQTEQCLHVQACWCRRIV